jgi:hypothetical protein
MLVLNAHGNYQDHRLETMTSRGTWLAIALLVALLLGAYGLYWRVTAQRLESGIAEWTVWQRQSGGRVEYSWSGIGGFPLAFRATFVAPTLDVMVAPGIRVRWSGPSMVAEMRPWNLRRVFATAEGGHEVLIGHSPAAGEWRVNASTLRGAVSFHANGGIDTFDIGGDGISAGGAGLGALVAERAGLTLRLPDNPPKDYQAALAAISLSADALVVPAALFLPYGRKIDRAELSMEIMGPLPAGEAMRAMRTWRDAGGVVEVRRALLRQASLAMSGSATLAFDAEMQPMGAGSLAAEGLAALETGRHRSDRTRCAALRAAVRRWNDR